VEARATLRASRVAEGRRLEAAGRHADAAALFAQSCDVTPAMTAQLIRALRACGVAFIVAPYEADAQLAYLVRHGLADAVLTEDSDLLVFGCPEVLFKLDLDGFDCWHGGVFHSNPMLTIWFVGLVATPRASG
jgi:exonuclease-1